MTNEKGYIIFTIRRYCLATFSMINVYVQK